MVTGNLQRRLGIDLAPAKSRLAVHAPAVAAEEPLGRTFISGALIQQIDDLLPEGVPHDEIARRLDVTTYVVRVIAGDEERTARGQQPDLFQHHAINRSVGTDAATVRMVQRMLEVGILPLNMIARETGVSLDMVNKIMHGQRPARSTERPPVFRDLGERYLPEPIRCDTCHAKIAIVPCRACRARRAAATMADLAAT